MAQKKPRASASLYDNCRMWSRQVLYKRLSLCSWTKARTVLILANRSSATCETVGPHRLNQDHTQCNNWHVISSMH